MEKVVVLYGSTGYTGKLIVDELKKTDLDVVLSGRNEEKLQEISNSSGFDYLRVDLDDSVQLRKMMEEVDVVIHAAGPFSKTARSMVETCIETGTHYLDITGEIEVFQSIHMMDAAAKEAEVMLLPGVGFDVVPSDCLSLFLKEQLPDAQDLTLWIGGSGKVSPGTAKTIAEGASKRTRVRRDGMIVFLDDPLMGTFDFGNGPVDTVSMSWGDVSTAYYSTGIPNITVFFRANKDLKDMARSGSFKRWILSLPFVQNMIKKRIEKEVKGPTAKEREDGYSVIFGEVKNDLNETKTAKLVTPEGYSLTAKTTVHILRKVLNGDLKAGFQTPAGLYGSDLIMEIDGVTRELIPANEE